MRIRITPKAEQQINRAKAWWAENRDKAPEMLDKELERALRLVEELPNIGTNVRHARLRNLHRLFLERVHYHLYYCVLGDVLWVVSLWHAARQPPRL